MRDRFCAALLALFALVGCNKVGDESAASAGPKSPGRYAGIGTFDAGRLWQQIKGAPASNESSTANLADDEHVIVVLDSHTGEIRQCGDHSGFCVAMNPWTAGANNAAAPVNLTKHAADLNAENEASSAEQGPRSKTAGKNSAH